MIKGRLLQLLLVGTLQLVSQTSHGMLSLATEHAAKAHDIFYYFAHGLRGNATRLHQRYFEGFFSDNKKILAANGPDCIEESISQSIDPQKISALSSMWQQMRARLYREWVLICALRRATMAQQEDQSRVTTCISQDGRSTNDCVYIGHSKGAALGANLLQTHVFKGAILIAPFCDASKAFRNFPPISSLPRMGFIDNYVVPCLRYFLLPKYDSKGQQPLDFADNSPNVSPQTPILIVSVKGDNKVPQYHQVELYIKLKNTGHNVYFYELQSGNHDTLLGGGPHNRAHPEHRQLVAVIQGFQRYIERKEHDQPVASIVARENWYSSPTEQQLLTYFDVRQ